MSNAQDGSSTEVDELKAKLASAKETSEGEIKVREEVMLVLVTKFVVYTM
jgi:hypothetical protein